MGSPAQRRWCWLVRLAGHPVNSNLCKLLLWFVKANYLVSWSPSQCVNTYLWSHPQGRGNEWRVWFAVGWLRWSSKARQSDAQLGRLQWGEREDRTAASQLPCSSCRWLLTGSGLFLCAAGGSSLLVWKPQRLWDHPAHHGGEQAAACHHALSCTGRVRAGSCPAGITNTLV